MRPGGKAQGGRLGLAARVGLLAFLAFFVSCLGLAASCRAELADGSFAKADAALSLFSGRARLALVGRLLAFENLEEPYAVSPLAAFVVPSGGWERSWRQRDLYLALSLDLIDSDHFVFTPGFHLGLSQGFFKARNPSQAFYETWETKPALLWGPSLAARLRLSRDAGPFCDVSWDLFMARAEEAHETVVSGQGEGARDQDRQAEFSWARHEAVLAAGWRLGAFTPRAGVKYRVFDLKKTLTSNIPLAGMMGTGLALASAMNACPSRYAYATGAPFVPFAELSWRPLPNLSVTGATILSRDQDLSLSLALSF